MADHRGRQRRRHGAARPRRSSSRRRERRAQPEQPSRSTTTSSSSRSCSPPPKQDSVVLLFGDLETGTMHSRAHPPDRKSRATAACAFRAAGAKAASARPRMSVGEQRASRASTATTTAWRSTRQTKAKLRYVLLRNGDVVRSRTRSASTSRSPRRAAVDALRRLVNEH